MSKRKTIELRPVRESTADYEAMERRIKAAFKKLLYEPLLRELGMAKKTISNANNGPSALIRAIQEGRVTFSGGRLKGKLNAELTKELRRLGARWDSKGSTFVFPSGRLPPDIRVAVDRSAAEFAKKMAAADKLLQKNLPEEISGKIHLEDLFDSTIFKVDREIARTLSGLVVQPKLTAANRKKIAEEWQDNMELWIKNFTEEQIVSLRKSLQPKVLAGVRYEQTAKMIQESYGVTAKKAKFLARQETALLMTKMKETRYTDAGVHQYKWRCVTGTDAHPVRPSHKVLDGQVFRWDDPPVTTAPDEPARRNNPGQDYNCRCAAIPIVTLSE